MGASQNSHGIEPTYLQQRFPKTYLKCIVIPNSRWLNILDKDLTKTADELEEMISEDGKLFIDVICQQLVPVESCL